MVALFRTAVGSAANIALNLTLIPRYGTSGAAIAALLSYTLATFSFLAVRDLRNHGTLMAQSVSPRFLLGELGRIIGN